MIHLTKRPLPPGVTIKSEQDYRSRAIFKMLAEDCHNKCYICEDKPTAINVEHIVPHHNDPALKYDWNNLLIACGHCNNIKGTRFDEILNPVKCDPEEHISLSVEITDDLMERVRVETLTADAGTAQTAELLEYVYNGGSTGIKDIECANLRNEHLLPIIRLFLQFIHDYQEEPDVGYDKIINDEIARSSVFAAFKRKIIRDDPDLSQKFTDALR